MNGTSKIRKVANPKTILEQIGSQHFVRDHENGSQLESPTSNAAAQNADAVSNPVPPVNDVESGDAPGQSTVSAIEPVADSFSQPRLRIVRPDNDSEFFEDGLDQPVEPSLQMTEIANHLRTRSERLARNESELKKQMNIWQNQVDSQIAMSAYRERELRDRESQIRSLQFDLLQLQNDVIDSQLAMEEIVEQFASEGAERADGQLVLALEMLRFEIRERFDYVSQRWDQLHERLEKLGNRRRKCA